MPRALLAALAAVLFIAPPAAAATGLRDDLRATGVALAGDQVIVARELNDDVVEIIAVPRVGGEAKRLLRVRSTIAIHRPEMAMAGSPERVAVIFEMGGFEGPQTGWRVYSGPPGGPLTVLLDTPDRGNPWEPLFVDVDGNRVLLVEGRQSDEKLRARDRPPPGSGGPRRRG